MVDNDVRTIQYSYFVRLFEKYQDDKSSFTKAGKAKIVTKLSLLVGALGMSHASEEIIYEV